MPRLTYQDQTPPHEDRQVLRTVPRKTVISPLWIEAGVVLLFCLLFAFFVISHARHISATYDETVHLASGYSYWLWNDYRMNPEHPPLVKQLAALPLLWLHVWPPPVDLTQQDPPATLPATLSVIRRAWVSGLAVRMQWIFAHFVFYGVRDEALNRMAVSDPLSLPTTTHLEKSDFLNDADRLLFWGRMPILLLGVLLAILIFFWARELYGVAGGVLALAFYSFDPNFIAHSGLVTTDVAVTVFMFGAMYFLWRACRRIGLTSATLAVLFSSLAFASKFSAVLLVPMVVLVGLGRIFSTEDWPVGAKGRYSLTSKRAKGLAFGGLIFASFITAYGVLWAVYGFRYSAAENPARAAQAEKRVLPLPAQLEKEPGHLPIESVVRRTALTSFSMMEPEMQRAMDDRAPIDMGGQLILLAQRAHLLPEAYIYGLAYAEMKSLRRASFLRGEYSDRGFWNYFLWTFLLKTPLPSIAAIIAALLLAMRRREPWCSRVAFVGVPVGVYFVASITSNLNIGHRHLLPIYPFLYVFCGELALEWSQWPSVRREIVALFTLGAVALSSLVVFAPPWKPAIVYPHYLAYFNELAGGPRNGYKSLVDSNLDWGQELKHLKAWLDRKQITEPINLSYLGTADPLYYQIPHVQLPGVYPSVDPPTPSFDSAKIPGYVAISATNLQGVYFTPELRNALKSFLKNAILLDTIGYSLFIYRIESPPQ
jgi:hypothetical protein